MLNYRFIKNFNMFGQIGDIIEGHYKEITNKENELYEKRIKICKQCPLYSIKPGLGEVCDSKKCWNEKDNVVETYPSSKNTCGCGCRLNAKTRLASSKCVLNRW
jgi:hypothetical protein